ncbi:L,D-transpeptidase family protein [Streptomyces sp. NPDC085946]|uniref:L,D-transpeptidase family protein n=1 Tax=Streptomyces sp. NPDC085946 TaxID=3365744 RepID=UPI0037D9033E
MTVRKSSALAVGAVVCAGVLGTGCAQQAQQSSSPGPVASGSSATRPASARPAPPDSSVRHLPGLGPAMRARVPDVSRQVLVVTGRTQDTGKAVAVLYERHPSQGWRSAAGPWPVHNGLRGWSHDHRVGDLRTPIGVFGLSDAGGRLPDPGTRLPYDHDPEYAIDGTGHLGEPLEGSFDYVVAIDYNRVPGTTPMDGTRPMGEDKGGGVWIHVDHGAPTNACLSLHEDHMRALLRALDPDKRPVVVMGPQQVLAS